MSTPNHFSSASSEASSSQWVPGHAVVRPQPWVLLTVLLGLGWGTMQLSRVYGLQHAALLLVGAAFGLTLYHARFGFTTAFRVFVVNGDGRGIRAQMLMLALTTLLFAPLLASGRVGSGAIAPLSLSVFVGAFIFSIGMQIGGG